MMINYRRETVQPSKWWTWNLCSRLQSEWVCHDWGQRWQWLSWESGQVSHHNQFTSSPLYPRYDSEGKYLGPLPDLKTPRAYHGCSSFLTSNNEKVISIQMLSNYLSSVFQTGLSCCWRWEQQWEGIEHRDLPTINKWMENRRKPSKVKTFVKSFELIIIIIATVIIIISF